MPTEAATIKDVMQRYLKKYGGLYFGIAVALAGPTLAVATATAASANVSAGPAPTLVARVSHLPVQDLGRAPGAIGVNLAFAFKYRNEAELEAFIRATSDPASPQYGHFLSPDQFTAAYAPTAGDYNRAVAALRQAGFAITRTSPGRTVLNASAPAAVVERFFGTVLHTVKQAGVKGSRYANATPAYLPAAVADVTFGVAGLNNLVIAKAQNVRAGRRHTNAQLGFPLEGPDFGLGPVAFANAYDLPVQHGRPGGAGKTFDGSGHAAGIVIDSDLPDSDLASFLAYFNVKRAGPPVVRVKVDGGADENEDNIETALDLETISSLAPGAAVYLYLMPSLSDVAIFDTYARAVADNKIDVLNSSFAGCEDYSEDNFSGMTDHLAQQGAAQGITFAASSGDLGAQACYGSTDTGLGVSAPASGPHFTAVGGTSLIIDTSANYLREFAWVGSGGGVSANFALPAYQRGVPHVIPTGRNVPDISFAGDPGTGASVILDGYFAGPIGGTSLGCPIFSALVTEYNQTISKRSGNINYALYYAYKSRGYGVRFRDITRGNNSYLGAGYTASPGYDNVTGIGSAIGTAHAK